MSSKILLIGMVVGVLCATGCATRESLVDQFRGTSHQLAIYNQLASPDAEVGSEPVVGMEGEAAVHTHDLYIKSFKEPVKPDPNKYTINTEH